MHNGGPMPLGLCAVPQGGELSNKYENRTALNTAPDRIHHRVAHPQEFTDTDPRALEVWLDLLRAMTLGERLGATFKATEFVLQTWESEIRSSHPDAAEAEVRLRVAARHLPRGLMIQVYGWDPAL